MRSWVFVVFAAVAVLAVGAFVFAGRSGTPVEAATAVHAPMAEFVDERAETRLPQTYVITVPFDGRVERITVREGDEVHPRPASRGPSKPGAEPDDSQAQPVAKMVTRDVALAVARSQAAVERLQASIRENDDTSVERTTHEQTMEIVKSTEASVKAAEGRLAASKARLDFAEENRGRQQTLYEQKQTTKQERDRAYVQYVEANVEYAQDQLVVTATKAIHAATYLLPKVVLQVIGRKTLSRDVLEKELAEAVAQRDQMLENQQRSTMYSPIDGVVLERMETNERFLGAGTPLLKVGNLHELEIEADILSQDVVDVREGCRVEIYGPAIGKTPVGGKVKRIYPAGFTKVSSLGVEQQRVKVVVAFDGGELSRLLADRQLGVGFRVRVKIFTQEKDHALVVPRSALFRGADGAWVLFVVRGGAAELQPVEIGLINDEQAEVLRGVAADEVVVLAPETGLESGTRVSPILRKRPTAPDHPRGD